jgi:thiol-disulfide isomerase/thioredoxin
MDEAPHRGSRRRHLKIGALAGLIGLLAAAGAATAVAALTGPDHRAADFELRLTPDDADGAATDTTPLVGKDADGTLVPTKSYEVLTGGLVSLRDHRGTPMVVNLWYSTCVPCRQEMPALQSVHEELGDQVTFVGLDVRESSTAARNFVEATGVTYENGLDRSGYFAEAFGVVTFPSTFLVDREGRIVATHLGAITASELRALIADVLR